MSLLPIAPVFAADFPLDLSGNDIVLSTALSNAGWDERSNVVARVVGNVGASNPGGAALICDVATEFNVRLVVPLGVTISGAGGDAAPVNSGNGGSGGTAIEVTDPIVIENEGTIQGGGGGGGLAPSDATGDPGGGAGLVAGSGRGAGADGTLTAGGAATGFAGDGGDPGQPGASAGTAGGLPGKSIEGYSLVTYSGGGTLTGPTA